jgi:nitroreductase
MFGLFDAPAVILVTVDKTLSLEYAMLDAGIFLQTFCLLAHDKGLGTCIMAAIVNYPVIVRDLFSIPDSKVLVMGAALGWPDPDAPVNAFERKRGTLEEFVKWVR